MEPLKQNIQNTGYNPPVLLKVYKAAKSPALEALEMLMRKFAPIVCLHPDEMFVPVSVLEYLQKAKLVSNAAKSQTGIAQQEINLVADTKGRFYFEPGEMLVTQRSSDATQCYVHARIHSENYTDLQYWFFQEQTGMATAHIKWLIDGTIKGYEGKIALDPLGKCNGTWERITVRINTQTGHAEEVFFPAMGKGAWLTADKLQKRGEQVVVFFSKSGRGFYPGPCFNQCEKVRFDLYSSQLEFGIHNEIGNGKEINFSELCELISAPHLRADIPIEPFWLNFQHHWGNPNPDFLTVPFIKRMIPVMFGKSIGFLLSKELLDTLVNYLLVYFSEEYRCKTLGPKFRKSWTGEEES